MGKPSDALLAKEEWRYEDLEFGPFVNSGQVQGFYCGTKSLDDFLNTQEVRKYQEEGLGETTLVYHQGELIGYYTVCPDGLRIELTKTYKSFSKWQELKITSIPAVKIGRLAVQEELRGRGIGSLLVRHIAGYALSTYGNSVRLLILESEPDSVAFYERIGFQLTHMTKRERNKDNRTMFLDLQPLREA